MTRRQFLIATLVALFGGLPIVGGVVARWAERAAAEEALRQRALAGAFTRVAEDLGQRIREQLDYEGWARKVYKVRQVDRGTRVKVR